LRKKAKIQLLPSKTRNQFNPGEFPHIMALSPEKEVANATHHNLPWSSSNDMSARARNQAVSLAVGAAFIPARTTSPATQRPSPAAAAATKAYEARATPGAGIGTFAVRAIPKGTLILAELPLLRLAMPDYTQTDIEAAYVHLSALDRARFDALHSVHGLTQQQSPKDRFLGFDSASARAQTQQWDAWRARTARARSVTSTFLANAMGSGAGAAVFAEASRFNHSCVPNASFYWDGDRGEEQIRAVRDIKAGEVRKEREGKEFFVRLSLAGCDISG
jgi:hypothetical protein